MAPRRLEGVDSMVLSLCARGLTTGEISAHLAEVYGTEVSKETISKITDAVLEEINDWLCRPIGSIRWCPSTRSTQGSATVRSRTVPTTPRSVSPSTANAVKCLYLVVRTLDPTGKGADRWMNRWKPALNTFAITFEGRLSPTDQ